MTNFWNGLWAMLMNNGMYSTGETIMILVLSVATTIAIMSFFSWRTERDQRNEMMATLSPKEYRDYLKWKAMLEETRK